MDIDLPLPDSRLHAHAKGHWRVKAAATKTARELAFLMALQAKRASGCDVFRGRVGVAYKIFVPDRKPRDAANIVQGCKPYIDGVVDAGIIPGDSWQELEILSVTVVLRPKQGGIRLSFSALPPEEKSLESRA